MVVVAGGGLEAVRGGAGAHGKQLVSVVGAGMAHELMRVLLGVVVGGLSNRPGRFRSTIRLCRCAQSRDAMLKVHLSEAVGGWPDIVTAGQCAFRPTMRLPDYTIR